MNALCVWVFKSGLSRKKVEYLFAGIGTVLGLLIAAPFSDVIPGGVAVGIMVALLLLGWAIGYSVNDKVDLEIYKHLTLSPESKKVTLLQRSLTSASLLKFVEAYKTTTQYNASKLVYTSATVGGVTTGGFHTTQASLSDKYEGSSGRYLPIVKLRDGTEMTVEDMVLTPEMVIDVRNYPEISKFLRGNTLHLRYSTPETNLTPEEKEVLRRAIQNKDYATQNNITQRAFHASLLTKEDSTAIKNWISGKG